MRRLVGASLLLAAFAALPCLELHAQKDKKAKKAVPTVDSSKLTGEFIGTLKSTPGSDRIFLLDSETKRLVPNKNARAAPRGNNSAGRIIQLQNDLARDQRQLATARTLQQRSQAVQRIQQHNYQLQVAIAQLANAKGGVPQGYRIETAKQEIEFQASEGVKVRTMLLPEAFDDKGNVKTYTKEQKAELKGKDRNLPGYESSLEKLEVGHKIRVVLAPAAKKAADKGKDADKDEATDADKKMQVKLIVILEEATSSAPKGKAPKKK